MLIKEKKLHNHVTSGSLSSTIFFLPPLSSFGFGFEQLRFLMLSLIYVTLEQNADWVVFWHYNESAGKNKTAFWEVLGYV